jgi:hypothetical protein
MATIFAANESRVLVDGEPVEGVTALDYRKSLARENVYALGSPERVGLVSGQQLVEGRLRVASTSKKLDLLDPAAQFQMSAVLKHGDQQMSVNFDECYLLEKTFELGVGGHGEAVYSFTATRVREELG